MPTVLLTRPKEEIPKDEKIFQRFGFDAVALPLIGFEEIEFTPPRLEEFDYIYFGSKRGVRFFLKRVREIPPTLKVIAVGQKTAGELKGWGIEPFRVLKGSVEDLVRSVQRGELPKGKLLAVTPEVYIKKIHRLEDLGFKLKVLPVYRTVFIRYPREEVLRAVEACEILIFTSPSTFFSLLENLQNDIKALNRKIIVAIGKTTAGAIRERGLEVSFIPSRPDSEVLARELAEAWNGFEGKNLKG
jgi:uroporphyrinogen-III synthase